MNTKEIIAHKPPFFPTVEDWNAFGELAAARNAIWQEWLGISTRKIRDHFIGSSQKGWSFIPCGVKTIDTKFYLSEFGPDSLFLCFGWTYELHLLLQNHDGFDTDEMNKLLETAEFAPILEAFDRIDRISENETKAMHFRNFHFGSSNDGIISVDELAWYAGNRTDEFGEQAIAQIEKFTENEEVTRLLGELNRRSKKQES